MVIIKRCTNKLIILFFRAMTIEIDGNVINVTQNVTKKAVIVTANQVFFCGNNVRNAICRP